MKTLAPVGTKNRSGQRSRGALPSVGNGTRERTERVSACIFSALRPRSRYRTNSASQLAISYRRPSANCSAPISSRDFRMNSSGSQSHIVPQHRLFPAQLLFVKLLTRARPLSHRGRPSTTGKVPVCGSIVLSKESKNTAKMCFPFSRPS